MNTASYKSVMLNKATVKKEWLLVDAENETLGRLASKVAYLLRGKHKTGYTPNVDCGDNVIVINAEKVRLTGNKINQKVYTRHTGFPGGQRHTSAKDMLKTYPERIIMLAVDRMLPKNKLGDKLRTNIYVYAGTDHKHEAQNPKEVKLNTIKEK